MTTTDLGAAISCPFCERENPLATGIEDSTTPGDGDVTLCIGCGRFGVFVAGPAGLTLRRPTYDERQEIRANRDAMRVRTAWLRASWGKP